MRYRSRIVALICLLLGATWAMAQDDATKQRFLDRKPTIDQWKTQGKVGENNVGKLEARQPLPPAEEQLVAAENLDRETVYAGIAARVGSPVLEVGKRRAQQIAGLAVPGTWLQHPDGHWYQR